MLHNFFSSISMSRRVWLRVFMFLLHRPCRDLNSCDCAGGSGLVDSNMMVLRKRIQSIRMHESCYDTPADWAEWERSAYAGYRADICLLLSTMQSQLLTMRPGTALSIVSVLMAVLPVMSILFLSALGTQLWSLHCALLELGAALHQ